MTKRKPLVNESVIRRWGKLANMPALTENFLDTVSEEDELEEAEEEMEMKMDDDAAEAPAEEQEAVEKIVSAVVDAISQETGVDIEVEGDAGGEEPKMSMDDEDDDPAMRGKHGDEDKMAMRNPPNRPDFDFEEVEEGMRGDKKDKAAMRGDKKDKAAMRGDDDDDKEKSAMRGDKKMKKEELDLEVIDDEELTEAVLKRVVERLLKRQ
tara:strand:+ start:111 stop:737 length:627 start_codon:yes stop_codon:yes gene_type:complete